MLKNEVLQHLKHELASDQKVLANKNNDDPYYQGICDALKYAIELVELID